MKRLRVIHLLDDFAAGGVRQALSLYRHPELLRVANSKTVAVKPDNQLAPKLEADIIITHFPPRWRALPFLMSLRARNRNAMLVHVEHSYTRAWEMQNVPSQRRFRLMMRLAYSLYDKVVAVSYGQSRWLREAADITNGQLRVISPWSSHEGLDRLAPPDWAGDRRVVIGAYGRFVKEKGFDRLIEAFGQLDPARYALHIGGFGPDGARLKQLADGYPHIHLVGMVRDPAQFLKECDMVAMPSLWESYGLVATEARLAGRPIIVADVDGLPEQVGRGGLVVDFLDAERLAEQLSELNARRFAVMSRAARASVKGAFERRVRAWRALFQSVNDCPAG